jgi:hypothetical protein
LVDTTRHNVSLSVLDLKVNRTGDMIFVSLRGVYHYVVCIITWCVPLRGVYHYVVCIITWCVSLRGVYHYVVDDSILLRRYTPGVHRVDLPNSNTWMSSSANVHCGAGILRAPTAWTCLILTHVSPRGHTAGCHCVNHRKVRVLSKLGKQCIHSRDLC